MVIAFRGPAVSLPTVRGPPVAINSDLRKDQ
jgi:hypothetical protein